MGIVINGQSITKKQVGINCRFIAKKYFMKPRVSQRAFDFLIELFSLHPEWGERVGCGVEYIQVRENVVCGGHTKGFWIVRKDGTSVDVSWIQCLNKKSDEQIVKRAARHEINYQIVAFKNKYGECDGLHCDHVYPFWKIFADWRGARAIKVRWDGLYVFFADERLSIAWQNYHEKHATLQMIPAEENLKKGGRI